MKTEFDLNWGEISPDLYDEKNNEAVYVFNFSFISPEARNLVKKFAVGKVLWYHDQLPKNCRQVVELDLRGQDEIKYELEIQDEWIEDASNRIKKINNKANFHFGLIV